VPKVGILPAYITRWGRAFHGDALDVLRRLPTGSVALVLTSPPFALRRKKAYGNVAASEYVDWFCPFAQEIYRVLRRDGSFVLELGGGWNPGSGTRSLYQYELILRLTRKGFKSPGLPRDQAGNPDLQEAEPCFHLAQEFYWYNPSRLPTPAEWVTIRRTRVKDAVNMLWWLSKTETPQADNRRVLQPYSRSMRRLLRDGYKVARRPSQHDIGPHFQRDNGGAIPPNLLTIPNTRSHDEYLHDCRRAGLPIHPARFVPGVPEFFIRFLTQPGQLVLDPFAGSNVTGQVAESLERSWISVEINADYVAGSKLRFPGAVPGSTRTDSAAG
jgi:site-specific DNA-methyltransferase (cytosine-N4-specific)